MKKIWSYIALFFLGIIAGMITMYKLAGAKVNVSIARIKNKRTSGTTTTVIPLSVEVAEKARVRASKEERQEEKEKKRQGRKDKRAKRKANK